MPASKKKKPAPIQPVKPVAPPPPTATNNVPAAPALPVMYEKVEIAEYSTTSEKGPLTIDDLKTIMDWETESEFIARKVKEFPDTKPEKWKWLGELVESEVNGVKTLLPIHCNNVSGEKVICWKNAHNRPFDESWCEKLIHTHLYGQWAGPHTIPGETVNGETIRISRYGRVISGQHSITSAILADEQLQKDRIGGFDTKETPKYPAWVGHDHVFLESIVVKGLSEDPRVLMSVDYVKPRSVADVFYTSEVFKSSKPSERKELCKMLASAVDILWTRTKARGYKTHPEIVGFLERHQKLLKCVEFIYAENSVKAQRKISRLRLQPGTCAALTFIMASSGPKTDGDVYRNQNPPTEKGLDWSYWEKAEVFWSLLTRAGEFKPVCTALARLLDSSINDDNNEGFGGNANEKLAILAKAWELWRDTPVGAPFLVTAEDLELSYTDVDDKGDKLPDGEIKLLDIADFYGIDCPEVVGNARVVKSTTPEPPAPSEEEIEQLAREALARRGVKK
jgi:hypothetical protein